MKAISVIGQNIKGHTFAHELTPITIVVGENTAGKTAVLDAVRVALNGYDLRLGKRPADTFKLASAPSMTCSIAFDDGSNNALALQKSGKSITSERMEETIVPSILMDAQEYFDMPGPARRAYLFKLAAADVKFGAKDMIAALKNIKPEKSTPQTEGYIEGLCRHVEQLEKDRLLNHDTLDIWFVKLLASMNEQLSDVTANVRSYKAAGAVGVVDGMTVSPVESPDALEKTITEHGKAALFADKAAGAVTLALQENEAKKKKCKESEALLALIQEGTGTAKIAALEKELAEAFEKLAVYDGTDSKMDDAKQNLEFARNKRVTLYANTASNTVRLTQLKEQTGAAKCPTCGAPREQWDAIHREHDAENLKKIEELTALAAQIVEDQKVLESKIALCESDVAGLHESLRQKAILSAQCRNIENNISLYKTAMQQEVLKKQMLERTLQECQPTPDDMLDADLIQMYGDMLDAGTEVENSAALAAALTAKAQKLRDMCLELRKRHTAAVEARAKREAQERNAQRLQDAIAEKEVAAMAVAIVVEKQKEIIEKSIGDFMAKASNLIEGVLGRRLEYRDGDIGYSKGKAWVSHETFSGLEQHLAYVGLCLAFAKDSRIRVVIVDELGRLSPTSKIKLMSTLERMVKAGQLDNFIGADVSTANYGPASELVSFIEVK